MRVICLYMVVVVFFAFGRTIINIWESEKKYFFFFFFFFFVVVVVVVVVK